MVVLLLPVLLLVFGLLIVVSYYAAGAMYPDTPFRYRATPLNLLAALGTVMALLLFVIPMGPGDLPQIYITLYLLGSITACLCLDLMLQLFLRRPKVLYIVQGVLLAIFALPASAKLFFGTGW